MIEIYIEEPDRTNAIAVEDHEGDNIEEIEFNNKGNSFITFDVERMTFILD